MKQLVIYDSAFGNTKIIAEKIATQLGANIVAASDFSDKDLKDLELLIVGSPINGWMPLPTITAILDAFGADRLSAVKATSFDTRVKLFIHGDAKNKMAKALRAAGATIITEPMAFYVKGSKGPLLDGEIDRAVEWANAIKTKTANN